MISQHLKVSYLRAEIFVACLHGHHNIAWNTLGAPQPIRNKHFTCRNTNITTPVEGGIYRFNKMKLHLTSDHFSF